MTFLHSTSSLGSSISTSLSLRTALTCMETISDDVIISTSNAFTINLKSDDKIEVYAEQGKDSSPVIISINFLGHPSIKSTPSINPSLSWVCNGYQNYTIDLSNADSINSKVSTIIIHYSVKRGQYHYLWLFPSGLVLGAILVLIGLTPSPIFKFSASLKFQKWKNLKIPRFHKVILLFITKVKTIDYLVLVLLIFFLVISLFLNVEMLHNDEIGGGTVEWGYYAWGYVDSVEQITELVNKGITEYDSWHAVQNMTKPLFSIYLMVLFVKLFSSINSIIACRLFVQITFAFSAIIIYLLFKKMFDRKTGFMASFLIFLNPIIRCY